MNTKVDISLCHNAELLKVKAYSEESHPLKGQFAGALFYEDVDKFCSLMKERGLDLDGQVILRIDAPSTGDGWTSLISE